MRIIKQCLFLIVIVGFFACTKDNTNNPTPQNNDFYITFDLDGVPVEFRTTSVNYNVFSNPATTSSTIVDMNNFSNYARISFDISQDSFVEADFLAMVGQTIQVGYCTTSTPGACGLQSKLKYNNDSLSTESLDSANPLPNYYVKVNSASYHSTLQAFGMPNRKLYLVEGEFILKLGDLSSPSQKNATNGRFRLLFSEKTS